MNIGIIGYGSMGRLLTEKFAAAGKPEDGSIFVSSRTKEKLHSLQAGVNGCGSNSEAAAQADVVFLCVKPGDMKDILEEICPALKPESLLVSLNGSISFVQLEKIADRRIAKIIPSVTAEINRSQTLACFNRRATEEDRQQLRKLLSCLGEVIELPEKEMGMGSELVSCMPGFIASIFDVICQSAKKHTEISSEQIVQMVLKTVSATSELMLKKEMTFEDVVSRVATKGGITEEGAKVIYDGLPEVADLMFEKTLEKRKQTTKKAEELF